MTAAGASAASASSRARDGSDNHILLVTIARLHGTELVTDGLNVPWLAAGLPGTGSPGEVAMMDPNELAG